MKRNILIVVLIVFTYFSVYGQNSTPIDLILLLSTSSEMNSSYDTVNEYLTGPFLSENLRLGDTFHLIPFSASPRLDAARRVSEIGDVETIIGRMLLQYPIENGNDIGSALNFAEQYVLTLPSRSKKIVLLSTASSNTESLIAASRQRLNSNNTTLDFVQVTPGQALTNLPVSQREGITQQQTGTAPSLPQQTITTPSAQQQAGAAQTPQTSGQQQTTAPAQQAGADSTLPQTGIQQQEAAPSNTQTAQDSASGITQENSSLPADTGSAAVTPQDSGQTTPDTAAAGSSGTGSTSGETTRGTTQVSSSAGGLSAPLLALIIILALLLLGLIIFFVVRRSGSKKSRAAAVVSLSGKDEDDMSSFEDHSKHLAQYAAVQPKQRTTPYTSKNDNSKVPVISPTGPLLLNLFVEDQNTNIGKRNIHSLKSGYSLSVGGGNSDFLIFLVSIPPKIGEIRRNGSQCTFIPKKPKYFPDLGSNELRDCINKTIRIISDKNYEMHMRFEMYEDPLTALNRVLMSIKVPG